MKQLIGAIFDKCFSGTEEDNFGCSIILAGTILLILAIIYYT